MKFNSTLKIFNSITGCLFLFTTILNSQTYSFKNYGAESNIPDGFVYTLSQSDDGFLWVGTASGISRFDGFNFFNVQYPDSITNRYPTAALKDKTGSLWFGCSDGTVFKVKNNRLTVVPISNSKSISELLQGPDGLIYIIPQGKAIFSFSPANLADIHKYSFSSDPVLFSASFTNTDHLLIGTQENVLECKLSTDSVTVINVIEGFDSGVSAIHRTMDSTQFVIGTTDNGLFQLRKSKNGNSLSRFNNHPEWNLLGVQSIYEDSENDLWISTSGSGVIQIHISDNNERGIPVHTYNNESGLTANNVKTVFQDMEGNYWIGFYGEGISMLTSYAFGYYRPGKNSPENNILYINRYKDKYILGTPTGFHIFDPLSGKSVSFTNLAGHVGNSEITSFYLDSDSNLWIGTAGKGLFVRSSSGAVKLVHRSGDSGADNIKDIKIDRKNIWLATTNGVVVLDRWPPDIKAEKNKFDISNGLPHNSINTILLANDGNAYIGTESDRLYRIDP
jgi:ligand-binding sensor domain-containing protein